MSDKNSITKEQGTFEHDDVVAPGYQKSQDGPAVVGLNSEEIVDGYWKSMRFLGSCAAIIFQANSLFFGYAVPVG
jgi:hypothetical protein